MSTRSSLARWLTQLAHALHTAAAQLDPAADPDTKGTAE